MLASSGASAGPPPKSAHVARAVGKTAKIAEPPRRASPGRSVGSPTEGHLIGGAHLTEAPYLRIVPVYQPGDARWGLEPLVSMIDQAARLVRRQYPDAVLSVGHLSRPGGGEIDRHASHESGRDADVGFYIKNHLNGKPLYADHFVPFKGDGTAPSWPGADFDDARNWAFVSSVVADGRARVTHIFVAMPLRTRLLQYAERVGAPATIRTRAAELMAQPRGSLPHDDHFHIRIGCPSGMDKCIELPQAKKHGHHGAAVAKVSPPGHGATAAHVPDGNKAHPARTTRPAPSTHAKVSPPPKSDEAEKSESLVPNLAPMVPGLDSAIIPAPLAGTDSPSVPPSSPPPIIDDPDGILERP